MLPRALAQTNLPHRNVRPAPRRNTYALEKCFGWSGVLVEANPSNYAKLVRSGRNTSHFVHSAVCSGAPRTVNMTTGGGPVSGQVDAMSAAFVKLHWREHHSTVEVPCRSLTEIMSGAGHDSAAFLSLDVEGAEDKVLEAVDPAVFKVVMVEWPQYEDAKNERVHALLTRAGLRFHRTLHKGLMRAGGRQRVYVRADASVVSRCAPLHATGYCAPPSPPAGIV